MNADLSSVAKLGDSNLPLKARHLKHELDNTETNKEWMEQPLNHMLNRSLDTMASRIAHGSVGVSHDKVPLRGMIDKWELQNYKKLYNKYLLSVKNQGIIPHQGSKTYLLIHLLNFIICLT